MGKKISEKCLNCSKLHFSKRDRKNENDLISPLPDCWKGKVCEKKRSYYRRHDHYKAELRKYHRYLRYLNDHCAICQSKEELEAHHIEPRALYGADARFNIITLCTKCHHIITSYYTVIGIGRREYKD